MVQRFFITLSGGFDGDSVHPNGVHGIVGPPHLLGILYWYSVVPLHWIVFGGMLKGIKRAAESTKNGQGTDRNGTPTRSSQTVPNS